MDRCRFLFCLHAASAALVASLTVLPAPAQAQPTRQYIQYSSGTGFFINREGHVITNAHVVKNCQNIELRTADGTTAASLVAKDDTRDLAVLRAARVPGTVAPLRWNIKALQIGRPLYLYGYPGQRGSAGQPTFSRTKLAGLLGPSGEPEWLQLESVAQQGNSGGPVLDGSGNVIAVISGRAETYRTPTSAGGKPTLVSKADVAITLTALEAFLNKNQVTYYQSSSGLVALADPILQRNASRFVVNVRCLQGTVYK